MSKMPRRLEIALLLFFTTTGFAYAQTPVERLQKIIAANTLNQEGKKPFYIKIAFQLYDLSGKPVENGIVEEWWAAPGASRIVISSPSLTTLPPSSIGQSSALIFREKELIDELLQAAVHPLPAYRKFEGIKVVDVKRTGDEMPLRCVRADSINPQAPSTGNPTYCAEPANDALRLRTDEYGNTFSRNSMGVFHDTNVALDLQIAYGNLLAITGHVTAFSTFDPATSKIELIASAKDHTSQEESPELFAGGKIRDKVAPVYPSAAKSMQVGGTVVLHALITKQGTISDLAIIASPHPFLNQAALDAVQHWTYTPFLRNGEPISVATTIRINFLIR